MSQGAIYIITQDPRYVGLMLTSAKSLRRAMPELSITAFSQFPVSSPLFDNVIEVQPAKDGFFDKARLMGETPYERTLFIDADTHVEEPLTDLFSLLDHFDCAATHEEYVNTDWFGRYPRLDIPGCFPEFNTGVLMIKRSEKVDRFLHEWGHLYRSFLEEGPGEKINDQPFFRAAAYYSDLRIATIPREYNCKFRGQGYLNGTVKVFHGHVDFQMKPSHISKAIRALNGSKRPRVYVAGRVYEQEITGRLVGRRRARKVGSFPEVEPATLMMMRARRLREVIRERGITKTLAKVFAAKS